jgi:ABC-type arginine/histidine transport system permease subunit
VFVIKIQLALVFCSEIRLTLVFYGAIQSTLSVLWRDSNGLGVFQQDPTTCCSFPASFRPALKFLANLLVNFNQSLYDFAPSCSSLMGEC